MKLKNPYSLLMLAGIGCVSHLSNGWQSQKEKSRGGGVFNHIQPSSRRGFHLYLFPLDFPFNYIGN